jgi:predicted metal-dependent hydrolase
MASTSRTPADLVIHPRNVTFVHGDAAQRWWNGGDPVATAYYNSLSATFPMGEAFFIKSVRHFRNAVPAELRAQIDAFIRQEAAHSREHDSFNGRTKASGYDVSTIESELAARLAMTKDNPPVVNLAMTAALEHFTAIMAHAALKNDRSLRHMRPETAALWKWHSIEEIEHKAVAYDTFLAATRDWPHFKRWALRCIVMLRVSGTFVRSRLRNMRCYFEQDRINTPWTWVRTFYYLWVYPGVFRRIFPAWLRFFRPGFHPWDVDDRALISSNEAVLRTVPPYADGTVGSAAF